MFHPRTACSPHKKRVSIGVQPDTLSAGTGRTSSVGRGAPLAFSIHFSYSVRFFLALLLTQPRKIHVYSISLSISPIPSSLHSHPVLEANTNTTSLFLHRCAPSVPSYPCTLSVFRWHSNQTSTHSIFSGFFVRTSNNQHKVFLVSEWKVHFQNGPIWCMDGSTDGLK